jgi:hypothetical protein
MKPILTGLALWAALHSISAQAVTTGFTAGNEFTATMLRGDLSIRCHEHGETDYARFSCQQQILDPAEYSYFVTEPGDDADTVTLKATWENGKTVEKTEKFDRTSGRSKGSFNLWISTLFQRPLLDIGKNQVQFKLSRNGSSVRQGDFIAWIQEGADRKCPARFVTSFRLEECRNPSLACGNYFRGENYCE